MKGQAEVLPKPGKSFDLARIPKAIEDAGFSAPEVVATIVGTLAQSKDGLELYVPGLNQPFVLAGGPQGDALKKRTDLVGQKIRLTGKLHPSHGDLPPGLTVESFERIP